jgi:hypothetical protein
LKPRIQWKFAGGRYLWCAIINGTHVVHGFLSIGDGCRKLRQYLPGGILFL